MKDQILAKLSARERQVLELAAVGCTDSVISTRLGISEPTVNTYWGRVRMKLGQHSRTELVAIALSKESENSLVELRQENRRLNAELHKLEAERDPETPLHFFDAVLGLSTDPMLVADASGEIVSVNGPALSLFGYDNGELVGVSISELIPERFRAAHVIFRDEFVSRADDNEPGAHPTSAAVRKDGTEFHVHATISPFRCSAGAFVVCNLRAV